MSKKITAENAVYTEELRQKLIDFYKEDLIAIALASRAVILDQQRGKNVSEEELLKCIMASISGAFIIGFKQGNDMFLKDVEKTPEVDNS